MNHEISSVSEFYTVLNDIKVLYGYRIDAWKEADSFISDANTFFRGQKMKHRKITTSLSRNENYIRNEHHMYSETVRTKTDDLSAFNYPIEMLSKMQHYGLPTRLIDFSISPLIALFFAVQDETPDESGAVYVFKRKSTEYDEVMPQIVSLLPLVDTLSVDALIEQYSAVFDDSIDDETIKANINGISFIKYSSKIEDTNPRLYNQKGTFAVCGNALNDDGTISNRISELDVEDADTAILIAGVYKKHILDELKLYFGIDENYIYPEFTAWADYMKRKYGSVEYSVDALYWIIDSGDTVLPDVSLRRISAILNRAINTDDIKRVGSHIHADNKNGSDAVEIRIYSNFDNYTTRHWLAQCRWVSNDLDMKYWPFFCHNCDENGLEWEFAYNLTTRESYYQDQIFKEPKLLILSHHKYYRILLELFYQLDTAYEVMEDEHTLSSEIMKRRHTIIQCSEKMFMFGRAKDNNLDAYLCNYKDFASYMELLCLVSEDYVKYGPRYYYTIGNLLSECSRSVRSINRNKKRWTESLNINFDDMAFEHNEEATYKGLEFEQTIPVSDSAIDVRFDLEYSLADNGDLLIRCETNLFNNAELGVYLELKYSDPLSHERCVVEGEHFEVSFAQNLFSARHYTVEIRLPIPRTQSRKFLDLAGQEYEYLTGPLVCRAGIESVVIYREHFQINDGSINKTDYTAC